MSTITVDFPENAINNLAAPVIVEATQSALQATLAAIMDRWQTEAKEKLRSTAADYLMGLDASSKVYPYQEDPLSGAVILRGEMPNAVESGYSAFDIKVGFAKSERKHQKKKGKGWFMHIPMRHGTPGSFNYGTSMPTNIYKEAKKLKQRDSLVVEGGQRVSWTGYQHKNNIYDGLTRILKQYSKATQAKYTTFRTVSDTSDPKSWMHPGYKGVKIAESLERYAYETFKYNLERNLSRGGAGL